MKDHVPGGCFLMARTIFQSAIWKKHPQCFRLFFWLIGNANHADGYKYKGRELSQGQLITTYALIADALSYYFNRELIKPSMKEIRIMLSWLQSEGMITIKPLTDWVSLDNGEQGQNKGRPTVRTRAYVGLLITVIKYEPYQLLESYKGRHKGRPSVEQGQTINNKYKKKEKHMRESDDGFASFYESYPVRKGKQPALKAWSKLNPGEDLKQTIMEAIENQRRHKAELKERNQFCPEWPYPATWLNQHRWEDEVKAEQSRWEQ